ncbi:hypothetical protein CCACVL1_09949 [Corchorus capsularis]|uniref:Uncharacterized protein n=1 Tax=Corchorus capsularis TaxID=210143 RepID=A0A1R3ITH8_COCAP|nr:hypothetical protein CCACVL1_09949 [Corchorus capsularis]
MCCTHCFGVLRPVLLVVNQILISTHMGQPRMNLEHIFVAEGRFLLI